MDVGPCKLVEHVFFGDEPSAQHSGWVRESQCLSLPSMSFFDYVSVCFSFKNK